MHIGVIFPQVEFPADPVAVRDYAQAVEELGFSHIVAYDHVLGANPERPGGWTGPYTHQSSFLEPFVLYSFMAAHTTRLGFLTGILILPQRQTGLVAKQAATLDVLCGGRFRLGVGLGWNAVEYEALCDHAQHVGPTVADNEVVLRKPVVGSQPPSQLPLREPRIAMRLSQRLLEGRQRLGAGAQGVLIGSQLDHLLQTQLLPHLLGGLPGDVDGHLQELRTEPELLHGLFRDSSASRAANTRSGVMGTSASRTPTAS